MIRNSKGIIGNGSGGEDSVAAIALSPSDSELSRTVTLPSTLDPNISVAPVHLTIARLGDPFSGTLLTPNTDGTITINKDVLAFKVTCMAAIRTATAADIVLGISIGDPSVLPTLPGEITGTPPAGTYISRFRDSQKGNGTLRQVTLQTPYFPVGKTRTLGALAGDKIFPVAWTQDSQSRDVIFDDLIFAVEAIPLP